MRVLDTRRHKHVHTLDGEIGQVRGSWSIRVPPGIYLLLQEGHLLGRKEVAIPVSTVTGPRRNLAQPHPRARQISARERRHTQAG